MTKSFRPCLTLITVLTLLLLLKDGDIPSNPDPHNDISICYINVRSLCPTNRTRWIDEIHRLLCLKEEYDLICISESWNLTDDAIEIPNLQLFRNDRTDGNVVELQSMQTNPCPSRGEQIWRTTPWNWCPINFPLKENDLL